MVAAQEGGIYLYSVPESNNASGNGKFYLLVSSIHDMIR